MTFSQFNKYLCELSCINYTSSRLIYAEHYAEISLEGHPKRQSIAQQLLRDGFFQPNKNRFIFGIFLED